MSGFMSGFMSGMGDCDFFRQFDVPFPAEMRWQARVSEAVLRPSSRDGGVIAAQGAGKEAWN
jgi:hypothetical protein